MGAKQCARGVLPRGTVPAVETPGLSPLPEALLIAWLGLGGQADLSGSWHWLRLAELSLICDMV